MPSTLISPPSPSNANETPSTSPSDWVGALASCSMGWLLMVHSAQGLRMVQFADDEPAAREQARQWGAFVLTRGTPEQRERVEHSVQMLAQYLENLETVSTKRAHALETLWPTPPAMPLDESFGTRFQQRVWAALREIPCGETRSYGALAQSLGMPQGARAVAKACASNPLAVITPCHRVVGADGALRGYRWGEARKRTLLNLEATLRAVPTNR